MFAVTEAAFGDILPLNLASIVKHKQTLMTSSDEWMMLSIAVTSLDN
jgi:hypothetical protein